MFRDLLLRTMTTDGSRFLLPSRILSSAPFYYSCVGNKRYFVLKFGYFFLKVKAPNSTNGLMKNILKGRSAWVWNQHTHFLFTLLPVRSRSGLCILPFQLLLNNYVHVYFPRNGGYAPPAMGVLTVSNKTFAWLRDPPPQSGFGGGGGRVAFLGGI